MLNLRVLMKKMSRLRDISRRQKPGVQKTVDWNDVYEILRINDKDSVKNLSFVKRADCEERAIEIAKGLYVSAGRKVFILPLVSTKTTIKRFRVFV